MAGTNNVPERLVAFRVYSEGNDCLGTATVTLPNVEPMTDTVSGAGIAGEIDTPIMGHFGSMTVSLQWRTIEPNAVKLAAFKAHNLDIRGSQQVYDAANGVYKTVPVRLALKALPKSVNLGSFETGSTTDSETELEVSYLNLYIDGKSVMSISSTTSASSVTTTCSKPSVRTLVSLKKNE